jgi:hypothetical protein
LKRCGGGGKRAKIAATPGAAGKQPRAGGFDSAIFSFSSV